MKIFIDFDDVLFNTKKFKNDILNSFLKCGVPKYFFNKSYRDFPIKRNGKLKKYNPEEQIRKIKNELGINPGLLREKLKEILKNSSSYIFSDVENFLKNFKKSELHIVSFGENRFQEKKIKNSGISRYFQSVKIIDGNKSDWIKKTAKEKSTIYFFDDRTRFLKDVKKTIPRAVTFLVKRKEGRYDDKVNKFCDYEIKNLKGALKIINPPSLKLWRGKAKNGK